MREKIKLFFGKVLTIYKKVVDFIKKVIAFIRDYGFGLFNFLVLLMLYGVAWFSVNTHRAIITIGGLWILFIGGKFLYLLYSEKLFKKEKDETD